MNKNSTPNPCFNSFINYEGTLEEVLRNMLKDIYASSPSASKVRFIKAYAAAVNCCKSHIAGDLELMMN